MAETIKIGGELESKATGGVVARANRIYDEDKQKYQSQVNAETDAHLATHDSAINGLEGQNYVTLVATDADADIAAVFTRLGVTPATDTVYRIANWKHDTTTKYNVNYYSEYAATGTTTADLVPISVENKGIDDVPTAGSENLVKSGGVFDGLQDIENEITVSEACALPNRDTSRSIDNTGTYKYTSNYSGYCNKNITFNVGDVVQVTITNNGSVATDYAIGEFVYTNYYPATGSVALSYVRGTVVAGESKTIRYTFVNEANIVVTHRTDNVEHSVLLVKGSLKDSVEELENIAETYVPKINKNTSDIGDIKTLIGNWKRYDGYYIDNSYLIKESSNSSFTVYKAVAGKTLSVKANASTYSTLFFLSDFNDSFSVGDSLSLCDENSKKQVIANTPVSFILPNNCNYLLVVNVASGVDRMPQLLKLGDYDYLASVNDNLLRIANPTNNDIETIKEDIETIYSSCNVLDDTYTDAADAVLSKSQEYDSDLKFVVFTDPHSWGANTYKSINEINKVGNIDFIAGLGDFQPYDTTAVKADSMIKITRSLSVAGRNLGLYAIGNHDIVPNSSYVNNGTYDASKTLSRKETFDCMCRHLNGKATFDEQNPYGGYYYVDFDASKIRVIVLNTSDVWSSNNTIAKHYKEAMTIQQAQVTWFADKALDFSAKANNTGWSVLVLCHNLINVHLDSVIIPLLVAFKNGEAINSEVTLTTAYGSDVNDTISLVHDYTSQGAMDVIGCVEGHTHVYNTYPQNTPDIGARQIREVTFEADNKTFNQYYWKEMDSLPAGDYFFEASHVTLLFTLSESYTNVKIGYKGYGISSNRSAGCQIVDSSTNEVLYTFTAEEGTPSAGATELTGFETDQPDNTPEAETCYIVGVDRSNRVLHITPYGHGTEKTVNY